MRFSHSCLPWLASVTLLLSIAIQPICQAADNSGQPILGWSFDQQPPGTIVGKANLEPWGPAAPEFPDFAKENQALSLNAPAYIRLEDTKEDDRYDFDNGDWISVEAWVNLYSIVQHAYIIGKGRTGRSGFESDNQNWAVRLSNHRGEACVNFLFRSRADEAGPADWHRWTSSKGFAPGSGWHHIAVSYQFGKPETIQGFVDGKPVKGAWDMGGPTKRAPVVDEDEVWIGSSMKGARSCSFNGEIDELKLYRNELPSELIASRYKYVPQPIKKPEVPEGKVLVQLLGPTATFDSIPRRMDEPQLEWHQDSLAFSQLPYKYDDWGIRDDWTEGNQKSMVVRAWTELTLPPGDYQLLVRSRGYSRLKIDDQDVVTTPRQPNRAGAHHVVDPLPKVPVPGMRPHFMSDSERIVDFHSDGKTHQILFEAIVGGPRYRLEFGESCIAIARPGEMFEIIGPGKTYPLTDEGWLAFAADHKQLVGDMNHKHRRAANQIQSDYWQQRHEYALQNLIEEPESREIDTLIAAKIDAVNAERQSASAATASDTFYRERIQPILASHCARCHSEKRQGELSVVDRQSLLEGGESGDPAVVPGDPDASYLIDLISADADDYRMPPKGDGLSDDEIAAVRQWITDGATMTQTPKPPVELTDNVDDYTFLRRVSIDTIGLSPTLEEIDKFFSDDPATRRDNAIDRLLNDPRWAENWVGYWQDVFAENPNLLKPTLNNTGPFRFWILEALQDNKPIDRFATELMMMRGSQWYGGSAGFSIASQNDVPMAAKAHVIGTAFMGVEMKCARCHDAPYHSWKQGDLFQMAAMLSRKSIKLPESSTVPAAFFEKQARKSLIEVTLKPGSTVRPEWPFASLSSDSAAGIVQDSADSRQVLAAQVTASRRFAEVIANRIWTRLMGAGIVQPVDDWEGNPPSDPALLSALADRLIQSGYDQKELQRAILSSDAYQRAAIPTDGEQRLFAGPYRRRMSAEQIVDTSLHAVGQTMRTEQLTMDVEGTLPPNTFVNFGFPKRSWEFTTLANERDRPSLALPRAQAIIDVLKAFGWRNSRPEPISQREETPNLIQPGVLANATFGTWLTRLSDHSELTQLALQDQDLDAFIDALYLRLLTRQPTDPERAQFRELLEPGYADRLVSDIDAFAPAPPKRFRYVSWSNHLNSEANVIKVEMEAYARQGDPPTRMLTEAWRLRAEDAIWSLLNSPEMIVIP
ncbi:Planctomycete cytochrome C [Rosistilla ulvae]|uniref:Planctomycete cytochrome C n=1 Tax=Rosistilla ulvae TaxID=1930277 RepID=A0A517M7Q1_9BACT|nr:DUF1553 domain-containing protein [Rosistilla ulvae]QDS90906.1 Planctomycete cytochrome C [Rosistilla ulvae]